MQVEQTTRATFHALLASMRRQIWLAGSHQTSPADPTVRVRDPSRLDRLLSAACLSLDMDNVKLRSEQEEKDMVQCHLWEQLPFQPTPFCLTGVLRGHSAAITCLRFSDDGSLLASVQDAFDEVWIWDTDSQVRVQRLPGSDMAFSPDGSVLAVIDEGSALWECATWRCLECLPLHPGFLAFSSDGTALITMNAAGRVSIVDVATQASVFAFDALTDLSRPGQPAFSPNLSCLALPTSANQAHLWLFESTSREALYLDTVPADFEEGLAFSPDGMFLSTLVAGKRKQRVQLYHVGKQENLGPLEPDVGLIWRGWWPPGPGPMQKRI